MKNLLLALLATTAIGFASCGSSCDAEDVSASATEVTTAQAAYLADSTACADYKSALEDFISDFDGCDGVTEQTISSYQALADGLDC